MARKGGKRGSSAARSAAAKKGWETRRKGGAKAKPAATKRTAASKPKAKRRGMPKTTSARGRALTNQRRAADLVRASRGGRGPSARAVRSVLIAQRARAFYAATGGGKKRSAVKAKSAVKIGKQIRAQGRAKATAARARVAGRARSRVVAKPVGGSSAKRPRTRAISDAKAGRIVARVDALRPAVRAASGSARRNQNAVNTYLRATDFLLAPSRRALRRGSQISANDSVRRAVANAKPAAQRPAAKLGFTQSDFQRRSQRTAGIRNPRVRETAQRLYGRVLDLGSSPRQLRTMFRKAGKPKAGRKSAAQRQSQREHRDMLALANRLF